MNAKSLVQIYESLSPGEQAKALASWMHAATIDARDTYIPGTQGIADPVRLRGFNELQHRIAGQLQSVLDGHKPERVEQETLMELICSAGKELRATTMQKVTGELGGSAPSSTRRERRAG
jgi:hypothetical protein